MTAELETRLMRRAPIQRRSTERVELMLDVCAVLLDQVGYEALTTKAIAEKAGISIGSGYQDFPDKKTMVRALAARYLEEFLQRLDQAVTETRLRGWRQLVTAMLRVYADMLDVSPGFRAIRIGPANGPYVMQPDEDNPRVIAAATRELFRRQVDLPDGPRVERVLVVALTMGDALLQLACRRDPAGDREILAELTSVVTRYLDQELPLPTG